MEEELDDLKADVRQLKEFIGAAEVKLQEIEDRVEQIENEQKERQEAEKRAVEESF